MMGSEDGMGSGSGELELELELGFGFWMRLRVGTTVSVCVLAMGRSNDHFGCCSMSGWDVKVKLMEVIKRGGARGCLLNV